MAGLFTSLVHPHARGEQRCAHKRLITSGSSPRSWGTGLLRKIFALRGSSPRSWGTVLHAPIVCYDGSTVHPHARGERYCSASRQACREPGSSPRSWGTVLQRVTVLASLSGSSPRSWGTGSWSLALYGQPVHPHARGEQAAARRCIVDNAVHPHARGEQIDGQKCILA